MRIEDLFWIGFVGGGLALLFAFIQLGRLLPLPTGVGASQDLAVALGKGTNAYLKWQLILSLGALVLVFGLSEGLVYLSYLNWTAPLALLSGGGCGLLVGVAGAKLSAAAGLRCADAAAERLDRGVDAALCAGSAVSFFAVGLGLVHLTGWTYLLKYQMGLGPEETARTLLLFGVGSALVSLLFRMGKVFARGSGMAAEAVDREMGLLPDDSKNPAAIADQVGHGVGSAAGMASGLYSTYENALLAALFLGMTSFIGQDMAWNAMLLPLAIAAAGVLTSLIGFLTIRPQERGDRYSLPWCLRSAALVPTLLTAVAALPIIYFLAGNWELYLPIFVGLGAGFLAPLAGEYFTSDTYRPARSLADSAEAGGAAAVTASLARGLFSAALPVLLTAGALLLSFWSAGGMADFDRGIYGAALAGVGMLSVSGVSLASALCGPAGDCAAHAASLTDADEAPRRRADNLAAIGVCAANGGKSLAAVSTALTGFFLLRCLAGILDAQPTSPSAHILFSLGILLGTAVVLLFSGLLLWAVRSAAKAALRQARLQFQDNEELMEGDEAPDYAACMSKCAVRSLLGFLPSALLALLAPIAAGVLLGVHGLMGFLGSLLVLSVTLALLLSLTGGVLGGARRYVESGRKGGRGSPCHRSLLTAERTAALLSHGVGPALLSLTRLAITLSLLCAALTAAFNLPALLG